MKLPVLILIYNRDLITIELIRSLNLYKPKKIYISSDGPKNSLEKTKILVLRKNILKNITWNCDIVKLYSNKNLGLKKKVEKSINFFFKKEKSGVILEDDCIPNLHFFKFCEIILHRYENNHKISMVSGTNLIGKKKI